MSRTFIGILIVVGLVCAGLAVSLIPIGDFGLRAGLAKNRHRSDIADAPPQRLISMAPNITETIFALGQGDRLVGVTNFCVFPSEAMRLPKVGGFYNPNLERLVALRPDLIALQGRHKKVTAFCRARNTAVLHVDMDSLSTIYDGITKLGDALGASERAEQLCTQIRSGLRQVRRHTKRMKKRRVFVSLSRTMGSMTNLYTVGGSSFVSQVVDVAGGRNIFADVTQPYPEVSKESLIKRAPEIILELYPGENMSDRRRRQILKEWNAFPTIPAVSHERIYVLTDDFLLVPGPRVVRAARRFAQAIHGEIYDR